MATRDSQPDSGTTVTEGGDRLVLNVTSDPANLAPVVADAVLATILEVPEQTPLHYLSQVDFDAAGRPVMRSLEWHVPSVIELRVYRRGPGPAGVVPARPGADGEQLAIDSKGRMP